jgi:hypothetical protein
MREVIVTALAVIPRKRPSPWLEGALALVPEPPAPFVARCPAMELLGGRRGRRGTERPEGYLASALGEADALRTVLDQAQHLEAQALHGGERRGRGRRSGDGAQDLVFLGAEL